jgi:MFS superfamily sulfate permease-like transporter
MVELGRRTGTTSWEPQEEEGVERVDHILALLFGEELFFANAGIFRREIHEYLAKFPDTEHVIIDAVAIADIDFTGMAALGQVMSDVTRDRISVSFARANDTVKMRLAKSSNSVIRSIALFDSTDAAATAAEAASKA